jgi:hypothetical protein
MIVFVVVDSDTDEQKSNINTGTKIYTRKHNAVTQAAKLTWRDRKCVVKEYELVYTENTYDCDGEFVHS